MLNRIINLSIKYKLIVILATLGIAAFGIFAVFQIPLGAVPDVTNNQVQVITTSTQLSTQDVEQFITYPVELEMSNLPGVLEIRSISKFGLSVVTIVFEDKMGTYLPRQLIAEKIKSASANIPEGFGTPEMGPITTGLGEIYQYILDTKPGYKDKYSISELRTIQDWVVKRQLSGITGVVEVNTWGGFLKQYEVALDPVRLKEMDISLLEVFDAIEANNSVAGGAYIEKQNQSYFIRGDGLVKSLDEIGEIVIRSSNGVPVFIKDVAEVRYGHANRFGAITANGEGEKVMGQIMMLKDANSNKVIKAVKERVEEVQSSLPEGVYINPIIERSELIGKTSFTVFENLIFGCLIVFFIVVLLLGNLRSGLVIASIIPLALLFTISMMYIFGIDANLMSLGALDFGIIIDGAVIIVEFIVVRITMNKEKLDQANPHDKQIMKDRITFEGATKMMNSAIFGQIIILIVFIPVLSLTGVEGKMFRPMALSFSFAVLGAMLFGLTWLPVAASLFLKPEKEKQWKLTTFIMKVLKKSYDPVIRWSYDHKGVILSLAVASLLLTGVIFSRMGGEFVPTLDEGDFVIQPVLKTGTSLSKTVELTTTMEQILIDSFPEVDQIVCRIGAAEVPTDPMSMEEIDMIIKLRPKDEWVSADSKEELANRFKEALSVLPGIDYEFTQPIEMRFNELITGVRADLAIKLFGEDLDILAEKAQEIRQLILDVPGAADVVYEKTEGLPQMSVNYKRHKLAYYGLSTRELNRYVTMAFGGEIAGVVFEGEKRFDLTVRMKPEYRNDIEHLRSLPVMIAGGVQVPLWELADIEYTKGPAKISRDEGKRRVVVSVNVRNRDLESVVSDIEQILEKNLYLPPGYVIDYGGQFENLENASKRLKLAVPIALLLIFIFLHFAFGSITEAALVFTAVPLSIVGGVFFLWIRGMPFSISAGIGFIALFGIAVLNGIVLIEHLKELKHQGITDMRERVLKATSERLRPVILTASAAALGFLPMAISHSAGAEVQRPLATVVIGGLVTSTMLTMLALPLLYAIVENFFENRTKKKRRWSVLMPVLLLLMPFNGHAQTESPDMTLSEAIELAYANNSEIQAYELFAREKAELVKTAYSIDKTSIYFNYDENNIAANNFPIGVVGIEQRLDFPGVYTAGKKASQFESAMAEDQLKIKKRELAYMISQLWYRTIYLQNQQNIVKELNSVFSRYVSAAESGYEYGDLAYLEVLNARTEQKQLNLLLEGIAYDIDAALQSISKLTGIDDPIQVSDTILSRINKQEGDSLSLPGRSYYKNQAAQQEALLKLNKNLMLPDLTLGYFNGTNFQTGAEHYQGVEIGLGIPLFFGAQRARIKANEYSYEASLKLIDAYENKLTTTLLTLEAELIKKDMNVSYYEQEGLELAKEIIHSAQKEFEAGNIDFFRLLTYLRKAADIQTAYLDTLLEYNMKVLEINYLTLSN